MADRPQDKDLETILASLDQDWRELVTLLKSQTQETSRVVEAERFVLLDRRGQGRGELKVEEDGAAGLVLADQAGKFRAWLGLKADGSAYLSLKDKFGRIVFAVPDGLGPPAPGTAAQPPEPLEVLPRLEGLERELAHLKETLAALARRESEDKAVLLEEEGEPRFPLGSKVLARLQTLERQNRLFKITGVVLALLLGLNLAGLAGLLGRVQWRGEPLVAEKLVIQGPGGAWARLGEEAGQVRLELCGREGWPRASLALGENGEPSLALYDRDQRLRAALALGPEGEPLLSLLDQEGLRRVALGRLDTEGLVRPVSSLVLFSERGNPIWTAPYRRYR
jgi:hypothetical protein